MNLLSVSSKHTRKKKQAFELSASTDTVEERSVKFHEEQTLTVSRQSNAGEDDVDQNNRRILSAMEERLLNAAATTPHKGKLVLDMITWKEPDRIDALLKTMKASDPYMDICGANDHPPGSVAHTLTAVQYMESALGSYDRASGLSYAKYFRKRLALFMRAKNHRTYLVRELFTCDMPEYHGKLKPRVVAYAIVSVFKGLKQSTLYDMQHHMYMDQGTPHHVSLRLHSLSGRLLQRGSDAASKLVKYAICHTYAAYRSTRQFHHKSNPLFTFVTSLYRVATPGVDFVFQLPASPSFPMPLTSSTLHPLPPAPAPPAPAPPAPAPPASAPPAPALPAPAPPAPVPPAPVPPAPAILSSQPLPSVILPVYKRLQSKQQHTARVEHDTRVCTKLTQFYNNKLGMHVAATLYVHLLQATWHVHDDFFQAKLNAYEKPDDIRYILLHNAADTNVYTMDIETANLQYVSKYIDDYRWRLNIVKQKHIQKHIDEFAPFGDELVMISPMRTIESFLES
jgi:hypothetical protein